MARIYSAEQAVGGAHNGWVVRVTEAGCLTALLKSNADYQPLRFATQTEAARYATRCARDWGR